MDNVHSKIPNIIYSDGSTTIGHLKTHQDFLDFKVDNTYCIRNPRRFNAYQRAGYSLYLIDNGENENFIKYAALMIKKGNGQRTYWGMDDIPMTESGAREFEATLTPRSLSFINQLCNSHKNNQLNCNRVNHPKRNIVRLTESQLRDLIFESVCQALKEITDQVLY